MYWEEWRNPIFLFYLNKSWKIKLFTSVYERVTI
ncbi:hypothetical protein BCQ_4212 [Bacillus cereus Q1]|uniref:Uncharacterized protein n=1 Tax=Bacillus cereus (strain Q1) TaxID=361100 RepID=B9IZ00_BACCQ|nr:hypothetical protein BCQ_4212 [Bacillus cereus Q1]